MGDNFIIDNKTSNLISIVNPGLKGKTGIEAALLYRILPCEEIDSSALVKSAYKKYYGNNIPDSADTILNAFISFRDFCISKLFIIAKNDRKAYPLNKNKKYRDDLNGLIYLYLGDIFKDYPSLRNLYDEYFDLMYSFSNFMPAPIYFNGSKGKSGKGTWKLNNDYPIKYLENLNEPTSGIYKREEMLKWLNDHMESYKIKDMYELQPPYEINEYYGPDDNKLSAVENYIKQAVRCIKNRFIE